MLKILNQILPLSIDKKSFKENLNKNKVVGVDFCGKFLNIALELQSKGLIEIESESIKDKKLRIQLNENQKANAQKAVFKQMTWIPNEIPKSDLVLFTMIDRVVNQLCKELFYFNLF